MLQFPPLRYEFQAYLVSNSEDYGTRVVVIPPQIEIVFVLHSCLVENLGCLYIKKLADVDEHVLETLVVKSLARGGRGAGAKE